MAFIVDALSSIDFYLGIHIAVEAESDNALYLLAFR